MVVTGGVVSGGGAIVHVAVAGDPTFPASSRARTANEWTPGARPLYAAGLEHGKNAPRSRLHRNVEPLSLARKVKEASPLVVFCGGRVTIVTVGGTASTSGVVAVCVSTDGVGVGFGVGFGFGFGFGFGAVCVVAAPFGYGAQPPLAATVVEPGGAVAAAVGGFAFAGFVVGGFACCGFAFGAAVCACVF